MCDCSEEFTSGAWGTVACARCGNGTFPAHEFFESCEAPDKAKLRALFARLADHGQIPNREKFRQVEGELFEIKSHQIRVSCYRDGMVWYLLHGFVKKKDRWPRQEVDRALRYIDEHRECRKRGGT